MTYNPIFDYEPTREEEEEEEEEDRGIVRFYLMRHGLSCANLSTKYCKWELLRRIQGSYKCRDPLLSNWPFYNEEDPDAREQVTNLRDRLLPTLKIDLVLSSFLMRAMETAHALFPDKTVIPVPHIGEKGYGGENQPLPWSTQKSILLQKYPELSLTGTQMKTSIKTRTKKTREEKKKKNGLSWMDSRFVQRNLRNTNDFNKFLEFFYYNFWKKRSISNRVNGRPLNVAVITHAKYLLNIFKALGRTEDSWGDVKNNAVYMLEYEPDDDWTLRNIRIIYRGIISPKLYKTSFSARCEPSCHNLVANCTKKTSKSNNNIDDNKEIIEFKTTQMILPSRDTLYSRSSLPTRKSTIKIDPNYGAIPLNIFSNPLKQPLLADYN